MSYIDNNLLPNEIIARRAKIHWFIYAPAVVFIILALPMFSNQDSAVSGVAFLFIALVFGIRAYITSISTELAITNKRVIAKHGFISRQTIELNLTKVESLNVDQSLFGRLFNFGKVVVNGTGGIKTPFKFIADPLSLRKAVNIQIENLEAGKPA